jgi:Predicted glycosyltransferases
MDAEVIVADSASTDGSMEMLAREFPQVRRIPLDKNYGFTGGYNRASSRWRPIITSSSTRTLRSLRTG